MKKSYNPFKMWGSWVGFVLGLPAGIFIFLLNIFGGMATLDNPSQGILTGIQKFIFFGLAPLFENSGLSDPTIISIGIASYMLYGFLIGWGIHSLFRKLS